MSDYTNIISRDLSNDPLVPTPVAAEVIQELPAASSILSLSRVVPMSSKTWRTPVLSVLPEAYFVNGDTGLKKTDDQDWTNLDLVAEELAVIVPIPEAYLDDAQVPVWDEVRPRLVEAFAKKIDAACLFGTDKPNTWGTAIVPGAVGANHVVPVGTNDDLAADVSAAAGLVAEDGFAVNGFVSAPGFRWKLIGLRTAGDGAPIYAPPAGAQPGTLYGFELNESRAGGFDVAEAELIAGDWTKSIVGLRQDITFSLFTEGVITDSEGDVILNLMQQDAVALRAVMRIAFATANPATRVNTNASTRFPFAVVGNSS